jgi:predicted naringenin-chalcone synthase
MKPSSTSQPLRAHPRRAHAHNGLTGDAASAQVRIVGLALAEPRTCFTQHEVLGLLGLSEDEFAQRIFRRCGVQRRHLDLAAELPHSTLQARTEQVEEQLMDYAIEAVERLELDPQRIGTIVSGTLYSLGGPTIAHRLVEHFGMDPATDKYHLVGVGCASAVPLVRLAGQALREQPGKQALVLAAESMSGLLAYAREGDPRAKTVGSSIFGDGCGALLLDGDADAKGPVVLASKVHQVAGTLGAVSMQLAPHDSYLHLDRELPDVAGAHLPALLDDFLRDNGLTRQAIHHWLIHPGGRRIIESARDALSLSEEDVAVSFEVLANHGNVGTPSIFYVLHRAVQQRSPRAGERGLMVTVGPGVTIGLMLLRW